VPPQLAAPAPDLPRFYVSAQLCPSAAASFAHRPWKCRSGPSGRPESFEPFQANGASGRRARCATRSGYVWRSGRAPLFAAEPDSPPAMPLLEQARLIAHMPELVERVGANDNNSPRRGCSAPRSSRGD
jgi:hypothetical protein